ncbi:SRPBCC family protein [Herbiconiux sp. YIM B11900]|uniref:SRPBCC family protein n=1 Tax=Herbiconiux sp. YIM B11900 TaxID=3404131 RepID=UPI003F85C92D
MELVEFEAAAEAAVPPAEAFERVVPRDDATLFTGYLVLPAVVAVSEQTGPWNTPGEARTVHLSDGSRFREHLQRFEPPADPAATGVFDYRVTDYTKILGRLVSDAQARWRFEPLPGGGSRIRWSYGFRPRPRCRFVVRRLIGPLWSVYMRRSLAVCVRVAEGRE